MRNTGCVLCTAVTLLALTAPGMALAADTPASTPASKEEQLYNESHSAAAASVGTLNFVVGRLALECHEALDKPDAWVKEFVTAWQSRNGRYVQAAATYSADMMSYLERTKGTAAKDAAMRELVTAVRGQGAATVSDLIGSGDKKDKCVRAVGIIEAGKLDVTPALPGYAGITEIVAMLESAHKTAQ